MVTKVYEIPPDRLKTVKAVLEAPDKKDLKTGEWIVNEFVINGYKLTDARGLGLESTATYVYIKASPEFFSKNEKLLIDAGAKKLEGVDLEKVRKKFETAEESAEAGFGAIFGEQ